MAESITQSTRVEDLVEQHPQAIGMFIEQGLPCVVCGEPFWGTIAELAALKNWEPAQVEKLVLELNRRLLKSE